MSALQETMERTPELQDAGARLKEFNGNGMVTTVLGETPIVAFAPASLATLDKIASISDGNTQEAQGLLDAASAVEDVLAEPTKNYRGINTRTKVSLTVLALALGTAGCGIPRETRSPSPEGTPRFLPIIGAPASGADRPTIEPAPKSGYQENKTTNEITYKTEEGGVLSVPQINGLKAVVNEENGVKKVVYKASPDNTFGLEPGQNVGEYNPNVSMVIDGINKKTGGVTFNSVVVSKLQETTNKAVFPLPINPKGNKVSVSVVQESVFGTNISFVKLSIAGERKSSLTNITSSPKGEVLIGKSFVKDTDGTLFWQYSAVTSAIADPKNPPPSNPFVLFHGDFSKNATFPSNFGDHISEVGTGTIKIAYGQGSTFENLTPGNILSMEGKDGLIPVFLAENTPAPTAQARPHGVPSFSQSREQSRKAKETNIAVFKAAELARRNVS